MTVHTCKTCRGDGRICPKCWKPWGHRGDGRIFGELKNVHRRRSGGCGLKRGESIACPDHHETYRECDFCGVRAPTVERPKSWTLERCPGALPGTPLADTCPSCLGSLRFGFDVALRAITGESAPSVVESIACAWAFHLGQYEDAARSEQWDRCDHEQPAATAPVRLRDWRSAGFIDPTTKGRYGWGRWSQVRRDADADEPPVPSARPHDPRRMRELIAAGASAEAAESALDMEAAGRGRIVRVLPDGDVLLEREMP